MDEPAPLWERLPVEGTDAAARHRALAAFHGRETTPVASVTYRSAGRVLVVGPGAVAAEAAARLPAGLRVSVLATTPFAGPRPPVHEWLEGACTALDGHLGAFSVVLELAGASREAGPFDSVLDVGGARLIERELAPPGYFAPRDAEALEAAIAGIGEMVGEFEKPRYFEYDASICAHGRSGIPGCTLCIDNCPAVAIRSLRDRIEVDPYLCQGGGVCAAGCPTGAIRYTMPRAGEWLDGVRVLLRDYRRAGGATPVLLLHDASTGAGLVAGAASDLPGNVLPVELEEVGGAGLDNWLVALAYGAARVLLLVHDGVPASVRAELARQAGFADAALTALGYEAGRVAMVEAGAIAAAAPGTAVTEPATFAAAGSKRELLRAALGHLHAQAPTPVAETPLPAGAPFGEVLVDHDKCTLCMSCVSVCPAQALASGGDTPALRFVEWNCVQCGLCERACPEDAITRAPRLVFDAARQREKRTLHEEPPFLCVTCGKPFATQSVMKRMREKLSGHWMFQTPEAMSRLEMCEDCRVKDMFRRGEMSRH